MRKVRLTSIWPENNGTVFAGRYGPGHQYTVYRPRGTDDWQLLVPTAGRGRIGSPSGDFVPVPGELVLMRPGVRHDYGPLELDWQYTWVHFQPRPEWFDLLHWPEHAPGLMRLPLPDPALRQQVMSALDRTLASYPYHRRQLFAMNALEEVLLWCDLQNPLSQNRSGDPRVMRIIAHLGENLAEKVTLASLAEKAGISVSRLSHLFQEQVGMGPIQYLDIQRLEHARRLLETTDMPITLIAGEVGVDPRYFSLRFKQHTTLSPRAYRKRAAHP